MSQHDRPAHFGLEKLGDADLALADRSQDIRGRSVVDVDGERIGHVSGLFVDVEERKIRVLELHAGGFLGLGDRHFLLPNEAVVGVTPDQIRVDATRDHVIASPAYDPALVEAHTRESLQSTYDHYGLAPSWSTGQASSEPRTQQF